MLKSNGYKKTAYKLSSKKIVCDNNFEIYYNPFKLLISYCIAATVAAVCFALQVIFSFIPNIEFVTLILVFFSLVLKYSTSCLIINVYCCLNMAYWGISDTNVMYFVIFNFYSMWTVCFRPILLKYRWTLYITLGVMGYIFGGLYALSTWVTYDKAYALSYWIKGLIFDGVHGTGNIIIGAIFAPFLFKIAESLANKFNFLFSKRFINKYLPKIKEPSIIEDDKSKILESGLDNSSQEI